MALKTFRPTTPSTRQLVLIDRSQLFKGRPVKHLTEPQKEFGGRNNTGRITTRWRGGGHKKLYRVIDFKRRKFDVEGTVERIEYDPNRSSFIALDQVSGRRADLHPRPATPRRRRQGDLRHESGREARQRDAARGDAGRHDRAQRRVQGGRRRQDRAFGGHLRAVRRPRPRLRHSALELGRNPQGAPRVHGDGRRRFEPGPHERSDRQGRPQRLEGQAPFRSRYCDEPDRSPARRRRRPHQGRPSSGHAVGHSSRRA